MKKLHPNLENWLVGFNATVATLVENGFKATPTNAREGLANLTKGFITHIPEVKWIQDDLVDTAERQIPVRIYHPAPEKALPVLVYYHGGGHMSGSVTVYDPICRKLALASLYIVVSVDYRLAPECPYPAGINDAYGVAKNIWATLDSRKLKYKRSLSLAGDSGGAALVATVSARAQFDANLKLEHQVMIYPSLDYTMDSESMVRNGTGYLLHKSKIAWYFDNYFAAYEDRQHASPLYGKFTDKLPSTLIFTAEFCPLLDEGVAYVDKLKAAGVHAQRVHLDDMIHTFMNMEDLVPEVCEKVYQTIGKFLNQPA